MLAGLTSVFESSDEEIKQPVTTNEIVEMLDSEHFTEDFRLGERAVREVVTELATMGLVETWIDSRERQGRVKQITTTFDPEWVVDIRDDYLEQTEQVDLDEFVNFET